MGEADGVATEGLMVITEAVNFGSAAKHLEGAFHKPLIARIHRSRNFEGETSTICVEAQNSRQ
jgi:hypothetical protein